MPDYYLAPSLAQLRDELNAAFPRRDKASDGWVGDTSHAARASDHNPDYAAGGIVRAIDVDSNGAAGAETELVDQLLAAAIGDDRVWYVIWNRRIYSRTHDWLSLPYAGAPHDHHVHVSIRHTPSAATDTSRWLNREEEDMFTDDDRKLLRDVRAEQLRGNRAIGLLLRKIIKAIKR